MNTSVSKCGKNAYHWIFCFPSKARNRYNRVPPVVQGATPDIFISHNYVSVHFASDIKVT